MIKSMKLDEEDITIEKVQELSQKGNITVKSEVVKKRKGRPKKVDLWLEREKRREEDQLTPYLTGLLWVLLKSLHVLDDLRSEKDFAKFLRDLIKKVKTNFDKHVDEKFFTPQRKKLSGEEEKKHEDYKP